MTEHSSLDGKALPLQIDARHGATFKFDAATIASALHHHQSLSDRFSLVAVLGDGTRVKSQGTLNLVDCLMLDDDHDPLEHKPTVTRVMDTELRAKRKSKSKKSKGSINRK